MPPASDGIRTVGCRLSKLVTDEVHLLNIQDAVLRCHKATIYASELVNIHLRRCLEGEADTELALFFNKTWLLNVFNEVTLGKSTKVIQSLRDTDLKYMPPFESPSRIGIQQCLLYAAENLSTVASTGVWMHFQKRILSHVRRHHTLDLNEYNLLSKDEKRRRKLILLHVANDICKQPEIPYESPPEWHDWVHVERRRLGIDKAVGEWKNRPILYHLKARPHCFLECMFRMSKESQDAGFKAFSLYPLRRNLVPKHVRFDQKALRDLLHLGTSEYTKQRDKERRLSKKRSIDEVEHTKEVPKRRAKEDMVEEKAALFAQVLDLKAAGVQRRHLFDFGFTTDGVCARLQMQTKKPLNTTLPLNAMPRRGQWAIDEMKHLGRLDNMHVISVDPGKRELFVGVDMDDTKSSSIRYTQQQRLKDMRSRQYKDEVDRSKPFHVQDAEADVAGYNSRSADMHSFCEYCKRRHKGLNVCIDFYSKLEHRHRRWKTVIKEQQSEERLYTKLRNVEKGDHRQLVLAYGSWGLIAGKPGAICNRGNPPCIGVGLMRKLARRFVVVPTPEAYTSKTCCRCLGECGAWIELEGERGKRIRGLRRCTQRDCMAPLNRDKNGAINIGLNFMRLMCDQNPIRSMTEEDIKLHQASLCMECD